MKHEARIKRPQSNEATKPPRRMRWIAWCSLVALCGALWGIAEPGYRAYRARLKPVNQSPTVAAVPQQNQPFTQFSAELGPLLDDISKTIASMPYTAHADLPSLAARIDRNAANVAALQWPACLSGARPALLSAIDLARQAVIMNHLRGNGINDQQVISALHTASAAIVLATEQIRNNRC